MLDDLFRFTSGPPDAPVVIVGESWGTEESRKRKPLVGLSGQECDLILAECGLDRHDILCTNVVHYQPPANDMWRLFTPTPEARKLGLADVRGLYPNERVKGGLDELYSVINSHPRKLVIGFGNYSLWALTEDSFSVGDFSPPGTRGEGRKIPTGITSWRGSQLYCRSEAGGFPFLPTYHPAAALRQWPWRYDIVHDLKVRVPLAESGWEEPEYGFIIRPSFTDVYETLSYLLDTLETSGVPQKLSVDLETRAGLIACCGIAWCSLEAICIPFMQAESDQCYWPTPEFHEILEFLRRILTHPNARIVGQNFLYDMQYLFEYLFVVPQVAMDTMIAHHTCWPGKPKGLDYLSSLYCAHHRYWKAEGKEWNPTIPEEQLWRYNCLDCVKTYEVSDELETLIPALELTEPNRIQHEQIPLVFDMMTRGVKIDREARPKLVGELMDVSRQITQRLNDLLPERIYPRKPKARPWTSSPKQQQEIIYDILGMKVIRDRKTGSVTLDEEALLVIKRREPLLTHLCDGLLELRSLKKSREALESKLDPDMRMRCSYNIPGADTFRWASSKNAWGRGMNLQNLSKGTEE